MARHLVVKAVPRNGSPFDVSCLRYSAFMLVCLLIAVGYPSVYFFLCSSDSPPPLRPRVCRVSVSSHACPSPELFEFVVSGEGGGASFSSAFVCAQPTNPRDNMPFPSVPIAVVVAPASLTSRPFFSFLPVSAAYPASHPTHVLSIRSL